MLTQGDKDKLKVLGIDVPKLEEAIKSESEVEIAVPALEMKEGKVTLGETSVSMEGWLSPDQKETFGKNKRSEGFVEGEQAMTEKKAKFFKNKYEVDIEGKDFDSVVDAVVEKRVKDSGSNAEWVEEKKQLQEKIRVAEKKAADAESSFNEKSHIFTLRGEVSNLIEGDTTIAKSDLVDLFFMRYTPKQEDGKTVWYKGAEKLKDSTLDPLSTKEVLSSFIDEGKYLKKDGLNGGDPPPGSSGEKFKTMKEFQEYCEKNDILPNSEEGQKILQERKAEGVGDAFYEELA